MILTHSKTMAFPKKPHIGSFRRKRKTKQKKKTKNKNNNKKIGQTQSYTDGQILQDHSLLRPRSSLERRLFSLTKIQEQ